MVSLMRRAYSWASRPSGIPSAHASAFRLATTLAMIGMSEPVTFSKMRIGQRRRRSYSSTRAMTSWSVVTGSATRTTSPGKARSYAATKSRMPCPADLAVVIAEILPDAPEPVKPRAPRSHGLGGRGRARRARREHHRDEAEQAGGVAPRAGEDQQQRAGQQQRALPRARRRPEVADEPGPQHDDAECCGHRAPDDVRDRGAHQEQGRIVGEREGDDEPGE